MTVSTSGAAVAITPVVLKIFVEHYARRLKKKLKNSDKDAKDDILFDEAFNIVKAFIAFACRNTVESLQAFTNTHVPSPYWFKVTPILIPLSTCGRAATIIRTLLSSSSPTAINDLLGGPNWWTLRGINGVEAEWVGMKADVKGVSYEQVEREQERKDSREGKSKSKDKGKTRKETEEHVREQEEEDNKTSAKYSKGWDKLKRVMLYIHGGGFYWGSINTHRYQLGRFARKMKNGRVFTVNYRKAPHYPFPCALQDCIAAYLYLIDPPPGAPHVAVPASNIVIAGDSAGGNLALTLLTVIRDAGLPTPAGGVLISPWVDLTHSFDSILSNGPTDILTPHGFIHEPSPLWPLPPVGSDTHLTMSSTLLPRETAEDFNFAKVSMSRDALNLIKKDAPSYTLKTDDTTGDQVEVEIRSQIQLYAANDQLTHPLVSPVLHPSLGSLPPLYILAGDGECLRDEIAYLAHRCAEPKKYSLDGRKDVWGYGSRKWDEKGTDVRLQVFDEMCHVLTVFTFIDPAHYAYRAIGEFTRHVIPDSAIEDDFQAGTPPRIQNNRSSNQKFNTILEAPRLTFTTTSSESHIPQSRCISPIPSPPRHPTNHPSEQINTSAQKFAGKVEEKLMNLQADLAEGGREVGAELSSVNPTVSGKTPMMVSPALTPPNEEKEGGGVSGNRSNTDPDRTNTFRRQRISIHGVPRPLSPTSLPCLTLPASSIGVLKEGPVIRWVTGMIKYDKKYKRSSRKAIVKRNANLKRWESLVDVARSAGVGVDAGWEMNFRDSTDNDRDWEDVRDGRKMDILDVVAERIPPSAICGRRDVNESLALLRAALLSRKQHYDQLKAPIHRPSTQAREALDTAFHETAEDGLAEPSAAEVQVEPSGPGKAEQHGVRIWTGVMNYYHQRSKTKSKRLKSMRPSAKRKQSISTAIS